MSTTFFKLYSSVSTWLIDLANWPNISVEALPCQRGGIIEIEIILATLFLDFSVFFYLSVKP
ncbi:hypothetical protein CTT30_15540 [Vibrio coralliilyticus]|nr:hypothetical protein CTT30_15540 [Vibrio coralliilyticus]